MKKWLAPLVVVAMSIAGCTSKVPAVQSSASPRTPASQAVQHSPVGQPGQSAPTESIVPSQLQMVDEAIGWATTGDGVFRTSDGGRIWTSVNPPDFGPIATGAGSRIVPPGYFYGQENAWVVGPTVVDKDSKGSTPVFYTHDGGQTWQRTTVAAGQFQIAAFSDAQHGWGFTEAHATAMGIYTLFRTQDGGATWTQIATNRYGVKDNFPGVYMITGFTFRNESDGWATGRVRDVPLLWLYRTQDGGATWREQALALPAELKERPITTGQVRFFDQQNAMLQVTGRCSDTEECLSLYHSTDAGATWHGTTLLKYSAAGSFSYDFIDADRGVATDGDKVYTTADGGQHWTASAPNISLKGIKTLDFTTPATGWAVTESQLLKTTDGGLTWAPVMFNTGSPR
ncbi:MAG: hypothetical protein JWN15_1650 [Firmicutes bacterium]|nr:hypothetical protein [Bacillota bacterium]